MIATMEPAPLGDLTGHPEHTARTDAATPPCPHHPPCPGAHDSDRYRAHILVSHPEQGWSLLCNRIISFDDLGALLPDTAAA
jgi:hypothetical protein